MREREREEFLYERLSSLNLIIKMDSRKASLKDLGVAGMGNGIARTYEVGLSWVGLDGRIRAKVPVFKDSEVEARAYRLELLADEMEGVECTIHVRRYTYREDPEGMVRLVWVGKPEELVVDLAHESGR